MLELLKSRDYERYADFIFLLDHELVTCSLPAAVRSSLLKWYVDLHSGKNVLGILLGGKTDFYAILTVKCFYLTKRDYFFLYREVKGSKEKVISDKDLELLLDRSDLIGKSVFIWWCEVFLFPSVQQ